MTNTPDISDLAGFPGIRVGEDVHASIEHDTKGNPVLVLIAPLELDEHEEA